MMFLLFAATVGPHGRGGPRGGAALGGPAAVVNQPGAAVGGDRDAGPAVAEPAEEGAGRAAGRSALTFTLYILRSAPQAVS